MASQALVWLITGHFVVAACRNPSSASGLKALAEIAKDGLHTVRMDVSDTASIHNCAGEVNKILGDRGVGVDYLVNNAGVALRPDTAYSMNVDDLLQTFVTNVAGPARVSQAFLPLVEKSGKKTIVNVSSLMGSIGADVSGVSNASYSISKTALNMLTYKQAKEKPAVTTISICPGWLQTDLGGQNAQYPVAVGVAGVIKTVQSLTLADSGKFLNTKGEQYPW